MSEEQQGQSRERGAESTGEGSPPSDILSNQEPAEGQTNNTEQKRKDYLKQLGRFLVKPKTLLEIAALVVLICYTHYAGQQVKSMNDTVRLDQRAWLTVFRYQLPSEPQEGKPIQILVFLQNTGKTPALDEYMESAVISASPEPRLTTTFHSMLNFRKSLIPPGIGNSQTRSESWTPTHSELSSYIARTARLYLHARIHYVDIFRIQHWTTVCAFHTYGDPLEGFNLCADGNDIDRN